MRNTKPKAKIFRRIVPLNALNFLPPCKKQDITRPLDNIYLLSKIVLLFYFITYKEKFQYTFCTKCSEFEYFNDFFAKIHSPSLKTQAAILLITKHLS